MGLLIVLVWINIIFHFLAAISQLIHSIILAVKKLIPNDLRETTAVSYVLTMCKYSMNSEHELC